MKMIGNYLKANSVLFGKYFHQIVQNRLNDEAVPCLTEHTAVPLSSKKTLAALVSGTGITAKFKRATEVSPTLS